MDAWLTRMLERHRRAYLLGGLAVIYLAADVINFAAFITASRYLELSFSEILLSAAVVQAAMLVCTVIALAINWTTVRPLFTWARTGAMPKQSPEEWAVRGPRRLIVTILVAVLIIELPACMVLINTFADSTLEEWIAIVIGGLATLATAGVVAITGAELLCRPVRVAVRGISVGTSRAPGVVTSVVAVAALLMFIGMGGAGLWLIERGASPGPLVVWAIALGFTLILALPLAVLATTIRAPVRDLVSGTRAVGSGDLDAEVAVTTTDELGELATSFNEMARTLRSSSEELRASRRRIVASADESRRKVERDLHDGAQQSLVLLNLKLGLAERALRDDPEAAADQLTQARADLDQALAELRDLAHGVYPQVLASDGLPAALSDAAARAPVEVELSLEPPGRFEPQVETAIYFCCLEALQNAGKHAGADATVNVSLGRANGDLRFEVSDDGAGFDPASMNGTTGLQSMVDRIGALGGELAIESHPGRGTRVHGAVPLSPAAS